MDLLGVLAVVGVYYFWLKALGSPKKNHDGRMNAIKEKVQLLGGETIEIIQTKKSDELFKEIVFKDDGSYYVCYRVRYQMEGIEKCGAAILRLEQSMEAYNGVTDNRWMWLLDL